MIHDATGKFSSRWVFPDRSSLALVIRNWLHSSWHGAYADAQRMRGDRVPHIGEYAAKTNAISASRACLRAGSRPAVTKLAATSGCERGLLPVAFQHLI